MEPRFQCAKVVEKIGASIILDMEYFLHPFGGSINAPNKNVA
jgi:hypothetical protein